MAEDSSDRREQTLTAYVGVGSNIDPDENVRSALDRLSRSVRLTGVSTFYRTAPLGPGDAPDFYNGVVSLQTDLTPDQVRQLLGDVESALGRTRGEDRFAPRTIDLDLLLWQGGAREPASVHDDVMSRSFVAVPLLELAPDLILPGGERLADAARSVAHLPGEPLSELTRSLRQRFTRSNGVPESR
jgi:2-amino-4-hydroxy-6-hydroxymethyldihydropteridine diphosphokinase